MITFSYRTNKKHFNFCTDFKRASAKPVPELLLINLLFLFSGFRFFIPFLTVSLKAENSFIFSFPS